MIGIEPDAAYRSSSTALHRGCWVVAFTDGLTDCVDGGRERLGEAGLLDLVRTCLPASSADELAERILGGVRRFGMLDDDATVAVAGYRRRSGRRLATPWGWREGAGEPGGADQELPAGMSAVGPSPPRCSPPALRSPGSLEERSSFNSVGVPAPFRAKAPGSHESVETDRCS